MNEEAEEMNFNAIITKQASYCLKVLYICGGEKEESILCYAMLYYTVLCLSVWLRGRTGGIFIWTKPPCSSSRSQPPLGISIFPRITTDFQTKEISCFGENGCFGSELWLQSHSLFQRVITDQIKLTPPRPSKMIRYCQGRGFTKNSSCDRLSRLLQSGMFSGMFLPCACA